MDKKIVITGIGVLASNGIGKNEYWQALNQGKSGIKPITLFDTSNTNSKQAGEISDFNPEKIVGKKGLRTMDRATKLVLCAAQMAIEDSGLEVDSKSLEEAGVVLGSTLGSVWSISEFDKLSLREGPRAVNPAHFPNTVINSPASQVSIRFGIKGFNTTISTGFSSSLDAFGYALDFMKLNRAEVVLVGGVEELCLQTFLGFYKLGVLAGSKKGRPEISAPFDKKRNGMIIGEGAGMMVLETAEHAKKRGAMIYGRVKGYASAFDPRRRNGYNPKAEGATRAIEEALQDAKVEPGDIDYISSAANGTLECDVMEARAVNIVFGPKKKISSVKSMTAEAFSASGILQAISAVEVLNSGKIPPNINLENKDERCELDNIVVSPNGSIKANNVLINSFGPNGCNSGLVIGSSS